jgi:hypothetical protein
MEIKTMSEILSEKDVEAWREWVVAHGGRELPSIIASHEALRSRGTRLANAVEIAADAIEEHDQANGMSDPLVLALDVLTNAKGD